MIWSYIVTVIVTSLARKPLGWEEIDQQEPED
jgi:hypothetical protein